MANMGEVMTQDLKERVEEVLNNLETYTNLTQYLSEESIVVTYEHFVDAARLIKDQQARIDELENIFNDRYNRIFSEER